MASGVKSGMRSRERGSGESETREPDAISAGSNVVAETLHTDGRVCRWPEADRKCSACLPASCLSAASLPGPSLHLVLPASNAARAPTPRICSGHLLETFSRFCVVLRRVLAPMTRKRRSRSRCDCTMSRIECFPRHRHTHPLTPTCCASCQAAPRAWARPSLVLSSSCPDPCRPHTIHVLRLVGAPHWMRRSWQKT